MAVMTPELVDLAAQEAVAVRGEMPVSELPAFFGRAFAEAAAAAGAAGVQVVGPPFGYYPEMPGATVVVEAGFPVATRCEPVGPAHRLVLPGGPAVAMTHVGPYETLAKSYAALQDFAAERGLVPAAGMWESYLSDPGAEHDPSAWRTRIVCPVTRGERLASRAQG
jgi:effector-binding domain-containing protein